MKYIDEFILDRINSKKTRLESMILDKNSLKKILRDILVEFACTSNAIEGSTLSLEDTRTILESGSDFLGKAPYFQHLAFNHVNAFEYINRNTRAPPSINGVLELHGILMKNIDKEAGSFRDKKSNDKIQGKVEEFLEKINQYTEYHAIEKAAIVQSFFHQIRPFNYGTGSTSRLIAKWLLNYHGYIFGLDLNDYEIKYYRKCAEKAGRGTIYPLVSMMTKCVEGALDQMISQVTRLNIVSIEDAMKINRMNLEQMYEGIRSGMIKAYKKDGSIYIINQRIDKITRGAEILDLIL
ncbi:Fic family protein [Candidatus Bathyarchaeota archaeon]|nr:Fic family protein [Candidatus Bathyarchaeota archaeon]